MSETRENPELELARELVEKTSANIFLTGRAGTGKTTFLRQLREESAKRIVVVAPTGIAAINAGGVTIHSFFQLDFGPFIPGAIRNSKGKAYRFSEAKKELIRAIDLLVIDEISMVRSDLLDNIDSTLRRFRDPSLPFGGVQLLMIGDLLQLPPVVTDADEELLGKFYDSPYFFDSLALKKSGYITIELQHVYRQTDKHFIDLLNHIRDNTADRRVLDELNTRHIADFSTEGRSEKYIRLVTHNQQARRINDIQMDLLEEPEFRYAAKVSGKFPESSYPADAELRLRKGAQVMFVKNDSSGDRRYYNGSLGEISELDEEKIKVRLFDSGETVAVEPDTWENSRFDLNEESGEIQEIKEGDFKQYPLRPAWAITIHKSQGLTFPHAVINAASVFAHGQTYVALSRCKSLEGMVLDRPLSPQSIITDKRVSDFLKLQASRRPTATDREAMEKAYRRQLIGELMDFMPIYNGFMELSRTVETAYSKLFTSVVEGFKGELERIRTEIRDVAIRFGNVADRLTEEGSEESLKKLAEKIAGGGGYFSEKLVRTLETVREMPLQSDNKETIKKLKREREQLLETILTKKRLMEHFSTTGFSPEEYLRRKGEAAQEAENECRMNAKTSVRKKTPVPSEVENPEIYEALREWRHRESVRIGKPAFTILSNKALVALSNRRPMTDVELRGVYGIGEMTRRLWGKGILEVMSRFGDSQT